MAGTKSQVNSVKAIVKDILQYHHSDIISPELVHLELSHTAVPPEVYSVIIGSKGSEIKHIQGNFKISLYIPHADSVNQHVVLVGEADAVASAERYIIKQITNFQNRILNSNGGFMGASAETPPLPGQEDEEEMEPWMQQYMRNNAENQIDFGTVMDRAVSNRKK